jgi:hypothetical protein
LFRPSTSLASTTFKDVAARDKPGHDGEGVVSFLLTMVTDIVTSTPPCS